jgi:predicted acyl esterase
MGHRAVVRSPLSAATAAVAPHAPRVHRRVRWKGPRHRAGLAFVALALLAGACSSSTDAAEPTGTQAPKITTAATFDARGSVGQAYVRGARPGQQLVVADAEGNQVAAGVADDFGSFIARDLTPGDGYTFRSIDGDTVAGSEAFRVMDLADHPSQDFYDNQELRPGLNYLTMRDGTSVAATLRLPQGKTIDDGPFPTVIEYSGYAIAPPGDALSGLLDPENPDPLAPSTATAVGGIIAPLLGYATVSLQMRGSGCSGGAMGLFDLPTTADGYDAVEITAAEPWVKGNKVGMVGISFSGISQFFVGGSQPPHLAALAPFSPTDDLYSVGFPGGIYNNGFAASWLAERVSDAKPGPDGGQPWVKTLIEQGDTQCLENQKLRLQTQDINALLKDDPTRNPALYDDRSPAAWASKIDVPVFVVGAAQDEQTGGQWMQMVPEMDDNPDVWVSLVNGNHTDTLGPATISRWLEFLDLFVADQVPLARPEVQSFAGVLYTQLSGTDAAPVPDVRFTDAPDLETARGEFRKDARIRVLMESGGNPDSPGSIGPMWEATFSSWPPPVAEARAFFLGGGGVLSDAAPADESTVSWQPDPAARPKNSLPDGGVGAALPSFDWAPVTGSAGVGFLSPALSSDLTVIGPASVDLMLSSSATDTDLQVTVSEVRPDGQEMYVHSGFLRASARALDQQRSTELHPVPTWVAADRTPLTPGEMTSVRVSLQPIMYSFRTGSKIRITITAPGGDRPVWEFDTPPTNGSVTNTLALGGASPSKLVLPVIAGITPAVGQSVCPSLRGQPCRVTTTAGNGG